MWCPMWFIIVWRVIHQYVGWITLIVIHHAHLHLPGPYEIYDRDSEDI